MNQDNPQGFSLSPQPKPTKPIGSRPYYLVLGGIALVVLLVVSGLWLRSYIPALSPKQDDNTEERKGAAMNADYAASAVVKNMKADESENPKRSEQKVPDLSKVPSVLPGYGSESGLTQQTGQAAQSDPNQVQQLPAAEQVRLASYNREVEAMTTPLGQNQQSFEPPTGAASMPPATVGGFENAIPQLQEALSPKPKSHAQPDEYATVSMPPTGALIISAGTWIPATLEMLASSDMAGDLIARVTKDIFDARDGQRHLLIPIGTKLIGSHDGRIEYGHNRMAQIWNRMQFTNGSSITLGDTNGADIDGSTGVRDHTNQHYWELFRDAALITGFSAAIGLTQRNQSLLSTQSVSGSISQSVGQSLGQLGSAMIDRNLGRSPTVEARPGKEFFVVVARTIIFDRQPEI